MSAKSQRKEHDEELDDILSSALNDLEDDDDLDMDKGRASSKGKTKGASAPAAAGAKSTTTTTTTASSSSVTSPTVSGKKKADTNSLSAAAAQAAAVQAKGQEEATSKMGQVAGMDLEKEMQEFFTNLQNPEFAKTLESAFQALTSGGDLSSLLQGSASGGADASGFDQAEFEKIMESLKKLGSDAPSGSDGAAEEAMLKSLLQGMSSEAGGAAGGAGGSGDMASAFDGIMKKMLSKEVMGPSIKQVSTRYPVWLETNKSKFTAAQITIYEKQIALFKHVNNFYETNDDNFDRLLGMMNELQALGTPPDEFLKDLGPDLAPGGAPPPGCPTQ